MDISTNPAFSEKYFIDYLKFLQGEIITMQVHRKMFKDVMAIVQANPKINYSNSFYDWMFSAYVAEITLRIRRLVDCDPKTKSFVNFLCDLAKAPVIRTRKRHTDLYKDSPIYGFTDIRDQKFNELAGVGATEYGDILAHWDGARLIEKSHSIVRYADKFIAHTDKRAIGSDGKAKFELPTLGDVDAAIEFVDKMYRDYQMLIHASYPGESMLPSWSYDWKRIFRVPWIPPQDS